MQFVAIDVETANADMASVCQIGVAHFSAEGLTAEWKTYVDPRDYFDGINTSIHGIDEDVVAGAPTFDQVAVRVNALLSGQIVVTHTHFDRVAVHQAAGKWRVPVPTCRWLDSARVARRAWAELAHGGYGLSSVCQRIGYEFKHHDALEDAKAAGRVLLAAMAESGLDLNQWVQRVQQPLDLINAIPISRDGNPDGRLYGEVLVFTGAL
jgi:DNA polymerase-3 subunit epsilon